MSGPLSGINVLDLGIAGVGPWAATVLGFLGANVVRVEPPQGDRLHVQVPLQKGESTTYIFCNLNKRNIKLNLKDPVEKGYLEQLVREADVVMDNQRTGNVAKLGFGYEDLVKLNPQIIHAACPGWGFEGPMSDLPAVDPLIQAYSGFAGINGSEPGAIRPMQYPYLDFNASCFFASGIMVALAARERMGEKQQVTCTQLGSAMALQINGVAELFSTGVNPTAMGSASPSTAPHQAFQCQDLRYLALGIERNSQWQGLCTALGTEELAEDPRFSTNESRVANRDELTTILNSVFKTKPARWWAIKLTEHQVPHGYFYDFDTLRNHRQMVENDYILDLVAPDHGPMIVGGLPWVFSKTAGTVRPAPTPGQNNEELINGGFDGKHTPLPKIHPSAGGASGLPLAGKLVVDVTEGITGSFASWMLAEAGAEVIKVEPPEGDYTRHFMPQDNLGQSAIFTQLNRGKKGVALDIGQDSDKEKLGKLLKRADIFIEDWGPGGAEALGFGYEELTKANPGLVLCHLTPFGDKGPMAHLPGSELVVEAVADYWSTVTLPGEAPNRIGADIGYINTGCMVFIGALAALHHRERTGVGQRVDVSLLGTLMCLRGAMWAAITNPDDWFGLYCDSYTVPSGRYYKTKDFPVYLNLHNSTEEEFVTLLVEFGMEEALADPRFENGGRDAVGLGRYAGEVLEIWNNALQNFTSEEVIDMFTSKNAMACRYNTLEQAIDSQQFQTLKLVGEMEHPSLGKLRFLRTPWKGVWGETALDAATLYKIEP
jgi:crotonobetainyl-CoA:carnitine CoA-transferase CaiB-like acyl-CoA transferase